MAMKPWFACTAILFVSIVLLALLSAARSVAAQDRALDGCFVDGNAVPCPDSDDSGGDGGGRDRGSSPSASPQQIARWRSWQVNKEGIDLDNAGRKQEALEKFREAMEADPTNETVEGNYYSVKAELEFNDNPDLALADGQRAAELEPTAKMLEWLRRLQDQVASVHQAQANKAAANQAYDLIQQKRYADAIAILNELAARVPTSVWVQQTLAVAYRDLGDQYEGEAARYEQEKRWDDEVKSLESYADALQRLHKIDQDDRSYKRDLDLIETRLLMGGALDNYDFAHAANGMSDERLKFQLSVLQQIQRLDPTAVLDWRSNWPIADAVDFYSKLEAKVASAQTTDSGAASGELPDVAKNSIAAAQVPQTQGITPNLNGLDEIAKAESNCGIDGGSGCEAAGETIPPFHKSQELPGVVALESNVGPIGMNDAEIKQSVAWFAKSERMKLDAETELSDAERQMEQGVGDPIGLKAYKAELENEIKQYDQDELSAKGAIKKRLLDLGIAWKEAPGGATGQNR